MSIAILPERLGVEGLVFNVVPRPNRSTIEVTVERDTSLTVKVPDGRGVEDVRAFIKGKRGWIHRKLAEKDALIGPTVTKEFVNGEGFLYLGRSYRLKLVDLDETASNEAPDVRLVRGRFELRRDVDDPIAAMRSWYADVGGAWLRRRVRPWVERFGGHGDVELNVERLGYRWGSARPGGRLNLHWATLQLPTRLVDYVIVHELAHFHEPNHTPEFWANVERVLPDAPARRDELSQLGATIWLGAGR